MKSGNLQNRCNHKCLKYVDVVALKSECIMWPITGSRERGVRDKYKGPIPGDWKCAYRVSTSTPLLFSTPHSSADTGIQFPFASPFIWF